jgi:uncharacterized protein (TIRG00374 family)
MVAPTIIDQSFKKWKMWLAISFGLSIASFMLYRSISEVQFLKVTASTGDYKWVDANKNGVVDRSVIAEFVPDDKGDYQRQTVASALQQVHWTKYSICWLLAALLFMVGRDFFYVVRIRLLTHRKLTWKAGCKVILLWEFASALAPGVMSGAAVAMFILNKEKIALGKATAIVLVTAMMDNLFYLLMIPFIFFFVQSAQLFPQYPAGNIHVEGVFWTGFSVLVVVFLFLFSTIFLFPRLGKIVLNSVFSLPILRRWKLKAAETGNNLEQSSYEMREEKAGFWLSAFGATCGSWISRYLVINALLQAFLSLGFFQQLLVLGKQLVLWLFMRMSPTPGGSGVAEYAFSELLAPFSQSALLIAALAILWRLISYFPYLFIGAILVPRLRRENKKEH